MRKSGVLALVAAALFTPLMSHANAPEQDMDTLWEVLWHQAGTATRLVRWEQDLQVRVFGVNAAAHRQHTLKALRAVAAEAGVKVVDVSDRPDAAQLANVSIEITPNDSLTEAQPCETRLNFRMETALESVTTQMRDAEAYRCAYHEAMHMMGVRGHPEGHTVLSYFNPKVDGLMPLDKVMLRAWYSPQARGGMTPFEVLPLLTDQLVASTPDRQQAMQARDRFLARTIGEMEAFVEGRGDVPGIVKRSGKSTEPGIRFGRMEMSYFLAVAYQQGLGVKQDAAQAARWMRRAASMPDLSADAQMGTVLAGNR
jgi:hypothetical protein